MFDILAATYMSATRMDHFLEQDFMHRNPAITARLRRIHGLNGGDRTLSRKLRMRIGMEGSIERAHKPLLPIRAARAGLAGIGTGLRVVGEWLERASAKSLEREIRSEACC